jgi:hypothetical protein
VINNSNKKNTLCPSAQPEWEGSKAIGIVLGTADKPSVDFFPTTRPVTEDLLQLANPVNPTEVFRFAAPCMCSGCLHFKGDKCTLIQRIIGTLNEVGGALPICSIRNNCRWWQQEGSSACFRCPQVITENHNPSNLMVKAAILKT